MQIGNYVRFKVRGDQFDGLLGVITAIDSDESALIELLESSSFIGPFRAGNVGPLHKKERHPADIDELVLVSPLELLAQEAD